MIDTDGLTKTFGAVTAVDHISLHVREGEVFGFLGPNGAGKTTTVRMLTGLISKTAGEARVGGFDVGRPEEALAARRMTGLLPENVGLYEDLSALENLDLFGRLYDCPDDRRRENIERLLRLLGLWEKRTAPLATFSKGMKQKVALARALVHDPKVVFLDEPTANLDPESAKTVRDTILDLRRQGRTVFLTTHNLDEAQRVCDRVGVLKTRLLTVGSPDELRASFAAGATSIRLARLDTPLLAAIRDRLAGRTVTAEGTTLLVQVTDAERETPDLVEAIVAAGGRIVAIAERAPSLEDVYLRLVHR